jgi:hypothetical protein
MKSYNGIPLKVLDSLTVYLKFKTACSLYLCGTAFDFWKGTLKAATLEITAANVDKFKRLEHRCSTCLINVGLINVGGVINVWNNQLPYERKYDFEGQRDDSTLTTVRKMKAILLAIYRPEVYARLGGRL